MKINDKHLAFFASSNAPVDKEGYLVKKGEVNKAYQRRWFVLKGNLLFYYEKKTDKDPIGVVILEGCTVELTGTNEAYTFELVFSGVGSRTYVLGAESQEEMEAWMKAITCANYEYMRLLVNDLQKQLDELNLDQVSNSTTASVTNDVNLIDMGPGTLQEALTATASASKSRYNPFDTAVANDTSLFTTKSQSSKPGAMREFDEMHREFGLYIKKKLDEVGDAVHLLDL